MKISKTIYHDNVINHGNGYNVYYGNTKKHFTEEQKREIGAYISNQWGNDIFPDVARVYIVGQELGEEILHCAYELIQK